MSLPENICLLQHLEQQGTQISNQNNKNVTSYFSGLILWRLRVGGGGDYYAGYKNVKDVP